MQADGATEELLLAVRAAGAEWTLAAEPFEAYRHPAARRRRFRPRGRRPGTFSNYSVATRRDWRTAAALLPPMDQGQCNSCTAFALCAVASDLWAISGNAAGPLSPGFVHQCLGGCACGDSLDPGRAVSAMRTRPTPLRVAGDHPYDPRRCATARGVVRLAGSSPLRSPADAKAALRDGPVLVVMELYDDFWRLYAGGV